MSVRAETRVQPAPVTAPKVHSKLIQAQTRLAWILLAPSLLMDDLPRLRKGVIDCPTTIVHGWRDTVVPPTHSIAFARKYQATLHLLDTDHRMYDQLQTINHFFAHFLVAIDLRLGFR